MLLRALNKIKEDIKVIYEKDPAANNLAEVIFCYPGFQALLMHRVAHKLSYWKVPFVPRYISYLTRIITGIEIHPKAKIGNRVFIDHGDGIVIGETSIIGKNVKIYQGVTIGALSTRGGQRLSGKKRHPTICDNVTIYAGASILGGETIIGENTVIGGNAFITSSIGPNNKVSMKNLEMEYRTSNNEKKTKEVQQGEEWYYII